MQLISNYGVSFASDKQVSPKLMYYKGLNRFRTVFISSSLEERKANKQLLQNNIKIQKKQSLHGSLILTSKTLR